MSVEATILIPTHDHGPTLRASIASALRQTVPFEIFVIGDGVPDETRRIMDEILQRRRASAFLRLSEGPTAR